MHDVGSIICLGFFQICRRDFSHIAQHVLFTRLQLRQVGIDQLFAVVADLVGPAVLTGQRLFLIVCIIPGDGDRTIAVVRVKAGRQRALGQLVPDIHQAAGTVLGGNSDLPVDIEVALRIAPHDVLCKAFCDITEVRIRLLDLQFNIVAKGDLAVLRRRVVCSRGEHQSTIKCICRVYLILFKGQRHLAILINGIAADRFAFLVIRHIRGIADHAVCNGFFQLQASRQLVVYRTGQLGKGVRCQSEIHIHADLIIFFDRCAFLDVRPGIALTSLECDLGHGQCLIACGICFIQFSAQHHGVLRQFFLADRPDHKGGFLFVQLFVADAARRRPVLLLRLMGCGQIDHIRDLVRAQGHLGHLAVHVAGDHGQGAGIRFHIRHDAHGLGADGALLGLGLSGCRLQRKQGNVCIGRIIHDLRRVLFHRHRLGGDVVVEHDIAGHKLDLCRRLQPLRPAQVAAQGLHTGALRHRGLRHIRVVQAVGQEHHIPRTVGVAIPCTVTGVVAHGGLVLIVQLEVALTLLVTQLAFCHSGQVVGPRTGEHNIRLCAPCLLVLHIRQRVGQAVHGVVVLRQAADQHFLIAGIGVVVHRGIQTAVVHNGLKSHGIVKHRKGFLIHRHIVRVGFLHKFALFQTAHQLIFNGIAAVVVGVLEQVTDQAVILGVKAVISVHMLFLVAGQRFHFLIAVVGVLVGHKNVLRLRLCRIGGNVGIALLHTIICIKECAVVRLCGVPVLRFALLIAAHQHLLVALGGVLVLDLAALVVCRLGNTHTVQLPVDEQAGEQRQCQQQCHIPPRCLVFPAELLHQCRCDILHAFHPHYTKSSVFSSFAKPPNPRPIFILL